MITTLADEKIMEELQSYFHFRFSKTWENLTKSIASQWVLNFWWMLGKKLIWKLSTRDTLLQLMKQLLYNRNDQRDKKVIMLNWVSAKDTQRVQLGMWIKNRKAFRSTWRWQNLADKTIKVFDCFSFRSLLLPMANIITLLCTGHISQTEGYVSKAMRFR